MNVANTNWSTWCQWFCAESAVHLVVLPSRRLSRTKNSKYNMDGTKISQFQHVLESRFEILQLSASDLLQRYLRYLRYWYTNMYCFNHQDIKSNLKRQCNIMSMSQEWQRYHKMTWHAACCMHPGGLVPTSFSVVHHELQAFRIRKAKHLPVLNDEKRRINENDVKRDVWRFSSRNVSRNGSSSALPRCLGKHGLEAGLEVGGSRLFGSRLLFPTSSSVPFFVFVFG